MSVAGDPGLWADLFPDGLVPLILDLVLDAWAGFPTPGGCELEVPLTKRFCVALRRGKKRSHPFRIDWESPELDRRSADVLGRIDLRFSHGFREEVYFAFECKRLNVTYPGGTRASLAGEYVDEGMMRFIDQRYAGGLDKGGMLGYVMDGRLRAAVRAVAQAIRRRREKLRVVADGALLRSSLRPEDDRVRETRHWVGKQPLILHHVFLPVR